MDALIAWQNFLFVTKDEDTPMKVIDFGLSDFIRPGNSCLFLYYYWNTNMNKSGRLVNHFLF